MSHSADKSHAETTDDRLDKIEAHLDAISFALELHVMRFDALEAKVAELERERDRRDTYEQEQNERR